MWVVGVVIWLPFREWKEFHPECCWASQSPSRLCCAHGSIVIFVVCLVVRWHETFCANRKLLEQPCTCSNLCTNLLSTNDLPIFRWNSNVFIFNLEYKQWSVDCPNWVGTGWLHENTPEVRIGYSRLPDTLWNYCTYFANIGYDTWISATRLQ